MKITKIILRKMKMELNVPFVVSFGAMRDKHFIGVEVHTKTMLLYLPCLITGFPVTFRLSTVTGNKILQRRNPLSIKMP
jgi:hypothetical protein